MAVHPSHICTQQLKRFGVCSASESVYCPSNLETKVFFPQRCEAQRVMEWASFPHRWCLSPPWRAQKDWRQSALSHCSVFYFSADMVRKYLNLW